MIKPLHLILLFVVIFVAVVDRAVEVAYTPREIKPRQRHSNSMTLSFSGDVIQHMPQLAAARNDDGSYDFSRTFAYIDTIWRSVDYAVVNYETTVSANGKYTGYPFFSAPDDVASALYKAGVRVAALANNHCCDKGKAGIVKTVTTLDSIGLLTTGVALDVESSRNVLMLNKDKFRVALLNYTYSTNGLPIPKGTFVNLIDTAMMRRDIECARMDSAATHIIAFMHWGVEYQRRANNEQRRIGMWLREMGVDVVVGSHPHVVQDIDTVNRIVYSLGNFISNQQDQFTDSGLTVVVRLEHRKSPSIEYIPHWCDKFASVRKEKYRVLTERDTTLHRGEGLAKMHKALREARQAVGAASELKL